ncbi:MAG: CPBP family intramembrane glutamic endopeptidase [Methanosarcina sp.]|nr:CAAX protease [Methanosarcina sp. Ant1]
MEISENFREKTPDIENKWLYLAIPALAIAFAEILMYLGREVESLEMHAVILLGLSFSMMFLKNEEIQKTYQALILLPILRLVNLSIPVYYETTLYSLIFIYGILAIPASIAATHQGFTRMQLGITFKKMWLYVPFSILLGLLLAEGEYLIIRTNSLIPDLSIFNLMMLSIVMIFFVGLVEEIIFRSILQNRLEMMLGNQAGLIFTSVLFGLMHSGYGNVYEVIYASFVGLLIGYLFYRTRSLPLAVMIHGSINVFLFGIIPLLL